MAAISVAAALACSVGATFFACRAELRLLPAGLMLLDGLICRTTYHWLNAPNAAKE